MEKNGLLPIGKIVGVHGIRGNLKVFSYAETSAVFKAEGFVFILEKSGRYNKYRINWAGPYKRGALLSLEGITDRAQARAMTGSELFIEKSRLPELEEGVYYWFELIGLSVWTTENQMIGHIESIIQTGSNDVYVVKGEDGETLVPAMANVVLEIDLAQQTMRVSLPEGL